MPTVCSAFNCKSRAKKGTGLSFYKFPLSNKVRLAKWMQALRRPNFIPNRTHSLCSAHFEDNCFMKGYVNIRKLKEDAVPTKFNFPDISTKRNVKGKARKGFNKVQNVTIQNHLEERDSNENGETSVQPVIVTVMPSIEDNLHKLTVTGTARKSIHGIQKNQNHSEVIQQNENGIAQELSAVTALRPFREGNLPQLAITGTARKSLHGIQQKENRTMQQQSDPTTAVKLQLKSHLQARSETSNYDNFTLPCATTVIRNNVRPDDHTYFEENQKLLEMKKMYEIKIESMQKRYHMLAKKVKVLKRKCVRKEQTVFMLKNTVKSLKDQKLVKAEAMRILEENLTGAALEIFERNVFGNNSEEYSEEFKCFAITLFSSSSQAYTCVRDTFNKALPHRTTLKRWLRPTSFETPLAELLPEESI